ncbi:MAG: hypothetical protein P8O99_03910, partial [Pseudomonadales bacterium]|nr:hypothetical protein [Pseudomonadales bacterium]
MNRDRRAAYLQAMGIESWLPIKALPSAELGHWVADTAVFNPSAAANTALRQSSTGSTNTSTDAPISVTAQNIINRSQALAEELNMDAPANAQPKVIVTAEASNTPAAVVEATSTSTSTLTNNQSLDVFTLATTVCGDILIIDDITQMNFASSAYQHWLNAILLSLGQKPLPDTGSVQDRFDWPLPDSGLVDASLQAAKEIFSAWLQRKLQENNAHWVLLMGKAAVAMHVSDINDGNEGSESNKGGLGIVAPLNNSQSVRVLPTYGSGELWRQPLLKREFWQHIQPLRKA